VNLQAGPIAVAGATGFTGGLVAEVLAERSAPLRLIARNADRLAEAADRYPDATARPVPEWDERGLAAALEGCAAVIACAGPFASAGWPVIHAAIGAHVPYCDSTGEQHFIRGIFDQMDAPARAAGVPLVPAFGYDYVPGDLGAALLARELGELSELEVIYVSESAASSTGTRRSMIEILAAPGVELAGGSLRPSRVAGHRRRLATPFGAVEVMSIPGGEAITVPRHVAVRDVRTFIGSGRPLRGVAIMPLLGLLVRLRPVRRFVQRAFGARGPAGPVGASREKRFLCRVEGRSPDGRHGTVLLQGRDPYGFTAAALATLALRMASGGLTATGTLAPAQAVAPRSFLETLGVTIERSD